MAKLKVGEWFVFEGMPAVLLTIKTDMDGDVKSVFQRPGGEYEHNWQPLNDLNALPRTDAPRWSAVRTEKRSDDHEFRAVISPNGRKCVISAGCRVFGSLTDARAHWNGAARSWLGPVNNAKLNAWSLGYVAKVAEQMKALR